MKIDKTQLASMAVAALVVAAIVFLPGGGENPPPPRGNPVLVCIDSTTSTNDVRKKYKEDIETVVRQTAFNQDTFDAAACGANATGEVDWPVHERFHQSYTSEVLRSSQLRHQVDETINGSEPSSEDDESEGKEGIVDLLEVHSKDTTPIGEMLAVTARQCEGAGGACKVYMFTDGEWADGLLRVKDGVTERERRSYRHAYAGSLDGLKGSTVYFVGVGLGTKIGEPRLVEARSVAEELVESGGGKIGAWTTRLP